MIVVIARLTVKPDKKDELMELAKPLISATREEPGCNSYTLLDDRFDPSSCTFVEEWKDKEALRQHIKTPHFGEFMGKSKELMAAGMKLTLYEGTETAL